MNADVLLQELQKAGLVNEETGTKLKREVALSGRSLEDIIHERRLVDDVKIAELKSKTLNVPYQKIDLEKYDNSLLEFIPAETATTYKVAPIGKEKNLLVVGMVDPDDAKAQDALKFVGRRSHMSLGVYLISWSDWRDILRKYSPYKNEIEAAIKSLDIKAGGGRRVVELEENVKSVTEEAPIIRIVAETLREAVQGGASDVHIEPQQNYLRVRFRVDGVLREEAAMPVELSAPVISRVKVMSSLKIDETRIPQDGRFRAKVFERNIDFRVSTFPTPLGEKVAIRVLDPTVGLRDVDRLGLIGHNLDELKRALEKPFGLILVTGPTGSGKTTTIYALLQGLNKEGVNIVSLEDPVEYFISGLNQSQVHPEIGYDFASGLRQILRQDPDVIFVGEIRDNETASLAIHAALTGHVVLSTLHTNNAIGVIPRLIDMKVEPFLLPSAINLMTSQRLISSLCPSCKKAEEASPQVQKAIKKSLADLPKEISGKYSEPYKIYRAAGCNKCHMRGVLGRTPIYELFEMTKELDSIITSGSDKLTNQNIGAEAKRQGMITLRQDGVLKALEGLVSIEEVIRETEEV